MGQGMHTHVQIEKFTALYKRIGQAPLYQSKLLHISEEQWHLSRLEDLPLTTKEDIRATAPFGTLAVPMRQIAQYHESFGTTGTPTPSWFTAEDMETGGQQLLQSGVHLSADDVVLIRFPYALALPAHLMQRAALHVGATVVPASSRNLVTSYTRVLQLMQKLHVSVLAALPREVELLAETARLLGIDLQRDFPHLRAICVAGELVVEGRRNYLQQDWKVPVYNFYGSTETANIATTCTEGVLHIAEEDFYVEVLDENLSEPVQWGQRGRAVVTTLSHQGSPLLRYDNRDIISVQQGICACGRTGRQLTHYGRLDDRLLVSGRMLDAKDIHDAVYDLVPVPVTWKVVQHQEQLQVRLESEQQGQWCEAELQQHFEHRLQVPVIVEVQRSGTILDRQHLLHIAQTGKPVYIEKEEWSD